MKPLLLILLLAISVSAQSAKEGKKLDQWLFVAEGPLVRSFIAPETIKRGDDVIKVWMRFELPNGSRELYANTPKDFGEMRVYGLLKCKEGKAQAKTMIVYDRSGQFFAAQENAGEWANETPDTISHEVFLYFCERGEKPTTAPTLKPK